jgi:acyl dehydratase
MEISSNLAGEALRDYRKKITWRETMNYAAAVCDDNPLYFDDEKEDGIIAPPMYCAAVTWPVTEKLEEFLEPGLFPPDISVTKVHYTEHIVFHRPVRDADSLTVKGKVAAVLPHRAGTHVIIRYDVSDGEKLPVFTEHIGALLREVKCADSGKGGGNLPVAPSLAGKCPPYFEETVHIDPMRTFIYDGCTNIFFPIHTSRKFAKMAGLPGIILQGTATLAYAVRELVNREAGGDPRRLKILSCRFTGMVFPGTDIRIRLDGKTDRDDETDLHFTVLNRDGYKAISNGYALLVKNK